VAHVFQDKLVEDIVENSVPPMPFAKALTLFNQFFGLFVSRETLKSHSVASAIHCSIIVLSLPIGLMPDKGSFPL